MRGVLREKRRSGRHGYEVAVMRDGQPEDDHVRAIIEELDYDTLNNLLYGGVISECTNVSSRVWGKYGAKELGSVANSLVENVWRLHALANTGGSAMKRISTRFRTLSEALSSD